ERSIVVAPARQLVVVEVAESRFVLVENAPQSFRVALDLDVMEVPYVLGDRQLAATGGARPELGARAVRDRPGEPADGELERGDRRGGTGRIGLVIDGVVGHDAKRARAERHRELEAAAEPGDVSPQGRQTEIVAPLEPRELRLRGLGQPRRLGLRL